MKSSNSIFKFSEIRREHWGVGAAVFTLHNMGALKRKLLRGEYETVLRFIEEIAAARVMDDGLPPPPADYTPPPEQEST